MVTISHFGASELSCGSEFKNMRRSRLTDAHDDKIIPHSGSIYITCESTLSFFPETLLGSPEREDFYNKELGMYYFNR